SASTGLFLLRSHLRHELTKFDRVAGADMRSAACPRSGKCSEIVAKGLAPSSRSCRTRPVCAALPFGIAILQAQKRRPLTDEVRAAARLVPPPDGRLYAKKRRQRVLT